MRKLLTYIALFLSIGCLAAEPGGRSGCHAAELGARFGAGVEWGGNWQVFQATTYAFHSVSGTFYPYSDSGYKRSDDAYVAGVFSLDFASHSSASLIFGLSDFDCRLCMPASLRYSWSFRGNGAEGWMAMFEAGTFIGSGLLREKAVSAKAGAAYRLRLSRSLTMKISGGVRFVNHSPEVTDNRFGVIPRERVVYDSANHISPFVSLSLDL